MPALRDILWLRFGSVLMRGGAVCQRGVIMKLGLRSVPVRLLLLGKGALHCGQLGLWHPYRGMSFIVWERAIERHIWFTFTLF